MAACHSDICTLLIGHSPSLVFSFLLKQHWKNKKLKREKEMGNIFRRKATATLGT